MAENFLSPQSVRRIKNRVRYTQLMSYGESKFVLPTSFLQGERVNEAELLHHSGSGCFGLVCSAMGLPDHWCSSQAVRGVPHEQGPRTMHPVC